MSLPSRAQPRTVDGYSVPRIRESEGDCCRRLDGPAPSSDDGIDLDGAVDVIIERNVIRHNADDGIEKRFHARSGDPLVTIIRDNEIYGSGEDGIQLIDYDGDTNRQVWIHHNLIFDNAMAGIGSMADGNTIEDYTGAPLVEALFIHNNTIAGNDHGLVGGTNMVVLNNLFIGNAVGVKRVAGASVVAHALFFDNLEDTVDNGDEVAGDGDAGPDTDVSETAVLEARRQVHGSRSGCGCHLTPGAGGTETRPLSLLALVALAGLRRRVADTGSGFP